MKTNTLLITTILSAGLMLSVPLIATAADSITSGAVSTAGDKTTRAEMSDPRIAAASFVEHVNFARVSLAMKKTEQAKLHITQARNMMEEIKKSATVEQRRLTKIESGRVVYQYDTEYKYHYFPIKTGPVEVKSMDNGPAWATNDLAVTDADIVYLTLDLRGDKADGYLRGAEADIKQNRLKDADNKLAQLTDTVVTVDAESSMPNVKAHDNIALARSFIAGKNYEGASYALKHADEALDEMQKDNNNVARLDSIALMRTDVRSLQKYIDKKDPNLIEKADANMDKWWNDLKNWSNDDAADDSDQQ